MSSSSTVLMGTAHTSERSVCFYRTKNCYFLKSDNLHTIDRTSVSHKGLSSTSYQRKHYYCMYFRISSKTMDWPITKHMPQHFTKSHHSSKVVVIELCYRLSVVIVLCCYLCCSVIIVLFYVLIVCTVKLPPGVNPIAVDKYIYLYLYLILHMAHPHAYNH